MYLILKSLHGIFAYVSLILIFVSIAYSVYGLMKKIDFTKQSKMIMVSGLSGVHIQLVIGTLLYFFSPLGMSNISREMMKNSTSRLYAVEHPVMMLLGIVLITTGYVKSKKAAESKTKFRNIIIFYTLGILCFMSRMP